MKFNFIGKVILLAVISFSSACAQNKETIAYFPEWGVKYKPYFVKNIVTSGAADKITVINYAFCEPRPDSTGKLVPWFDYPDFAYTQIYSPENSVDGVADDSAQALRGHFNQLRKLKKLYPHIRIVVSIGGWLGSIHFSDAVKTPSARESFIDDLINMFIHGDLPVYNGAGGKGTAKGIFDGFDIDWEFPISGGAEGISHDSFDNNNLSEFYKLFRKKLDEINPAYLLTAALPSQSSLLANFNVKNDSKYLDWYCLMTYDFYGGWDPSTGHHTNLLESVTEPYSDRPKLSMDNVVKKLIDEFGISKDKIIPGVAFYGRGWQEVQDINNGLFQSGSAAPGIYEAGHNYYSDIETLRNRGYKLFWDEPALSPFLYNPDEKIFWTYENDESIALKARYCDAYDLRGIMFWDLAGDDSRGTLISALDKRSVKDVPLPKILLKSDLNVGISSPDDNDSFSAGDNIKIKADAADSFNKVEFFIDGKLLSIDTEPPFLSAYFNAAKGTHKIFAVAYEINGAKAESGAINILVK